jgi:hypothetical protein
MTYESVVGIALGICFTYILDAIIIQWIDQVKFPPYERCARSKENTFSSWDIVRTCPCHKFLLFKLVIAGVKPWELGSNENAVSPNKELGCKSVQASLCGRQKQ